jgi:CheY-like chemotaxis protein/phosphoribosyl 1,2-cyclic phosphodiesterase
MRVRFWGTRGSLARPGPATARYGGNTSCVELRGPDDALVVLDCGTGAHDLGRALGAAGPSPIRGHLLITHTHWDHIQGFPFFGPLFVRANEWDVYAPRGVGQRLEETLAGQMEYAYFPVNIRQLAATVRYHDLAEGGFEAGTFHVTARYLNHPALTLGYRCEAGGVAVVYATDHEPHSRHQRAPGAAEGATPLHLEDRRHVEFLAGADLVIHDAQYTLEEYPQRMTWGHTPAELAVDWARAAGARRLALFHHDPLRDDDALDRLLETCRARAGRALEVVAAAEGQVIELAPSPSGGRRRRASPAAGAPRPLAATLLLADDDADLLALVAEALAPEGYRLLRARDGDEALALARSEHPDLLLLDLKMPGRDGFEVCRSLRAESDPRLRDVPVVLLTGQGLGPEDTAAGFAAGVTDYLVKPFKPTHLRSRVNAWLLRQQAGHAAD